MTLQRLAPVFPGVKGVKATGVMQITRKSLTRQEIGMESAAFPVYGTD
jgi:hypothetical protein